MMHLALPEEIGQQEGPDEARGPSKRIPSSVSWRQSIAGPHRGTRPSAILLSAGQLIKTRVVIQSQERDLLIESATHLADQQRRLQGSGSQEEEICIIVGR